MFANEKAAPVSRTGGGMEQRHLPKYCTPTRISESIACAFARSIYDPLLTPRHLTLTQLSERIEQPATRDTKDGDGVVFADLAEPYRKSANVIAVTALAYDVESIGSVRPPQPAEVHARCALLRWQHAIYTTFNHAPDAPRYRLILTLSEPLAPDLYRKVWALPLKHLGLANCVDPACRDPARLYLLPARPAIRAHEFLHYLGSGAPLNSRSMGLIWAETEANKPKNPVLAARAFKGSSVIKQFNAANSVVDLLKSHGYEQRGQRWTKPGSRHGAGLILFEGERVYSHHATDELAGGPHDAFAVYVRLEHRGDVKAAVRAIRGVA